MAFTTTQIQAILDQLYSVISQRGGIRQVEFEGRKIIYESLDEVNAAIKHWESQLGRATGARPRVMTQSLRGFN